jgi:hypothetical protein
MGVASFCPGVRGKRYSGQRDQAPKVRENGVNNFGGFSVVRLGWGCVTYGWDPPPMHTDISPTLVTDYLPFLLNHFSSRISGVLGAILMSFERSN